LGDLVFLEDLGFGNGSGGTLLLKQTPQEHGNHVYRAGKSGFVVDNEKRPFDIGAFVLSLAGRQLSLIIDVEDNVDGIVNVLKETAKPKTISVGSVTTPPGKPFRVENYHQVFPAETPAVPT
jgi:hypothetical protein